MMEDCKNKPLTPRQEAFCNKYLETGNASEAYRYAYTTDRMKPETINNSGYKLLQKGEIRARLAYLRDNLAEAAGISALKIVRELEKIAKKTNTRTHTQEQKRTTEAKALLLEKLESNLGVLTVSCKQAGITRTQYYEWRKTDEEFKVQADAIQEVALDFVEHQLYKNIKSGDTQSILFYLRTKGKCRGYTERTEVQVEVPQFNDNRTNAEVARIFAERIKLYGEDE